MTNQGAGVIGGGPGARIEGLKTLAAYGKSKNVLVMMENRGRATPEQMVDLMKASGTLRESRHWKLPQ